MQHISKELDTMVIQIIAIPVAPLNLYPVAPASGPSDVLEPLAFAAAGLRSSSSPEPESRQKNGGLTTNLKGIELGKGNEMKVSSCKCFQEFVAIQEREGVVICRTLLGMRSGTS